MAIESSLTPEIGKNQNQKKKKKKSQLNFTSPDSSLTQGDSDSESTSASSSMQGSISSATSSLDQHSSNVKQEPRQKKPINKPVSKKLATFGSFMTSRRRAQSKLSQSSINLSDDGSPTPPHSSSIEASDESSNYVQKPMPKFKRTGSLRSVKIFRTNNKNNSNPNFKSIEKFPQISEQSHLEKATFSSILKDSKFPEQLKHQSQPSEPEELLPVARICPYHHCSLHGDHHHHHDHQEPKKRFPYLKKHSAKDRNIAKLKPKSKSKTSAKKGELEGAKMATEDDSIEFYWKTRSADVFSRDLIHDHGGSELDDVLFGVNTFEEQKKETPGSNNRDFDELKEGKESKDENSNGLKKSLEKTNHVSMWRMIHQHMVSGLEVKSEEMTVNSSANDDRNNLNDLKSDDDDDGNREVEIRKMFAIKLVRDAIEKILLPEVQDDQSTASEVVAEEQEEGEDPLEKREVVSDRKDESPEEKPGTETKKGSGKGAPSRWSNLKKVILLKRFVKELEKVKKFNLKKPHHLPLPPERETETVSLRRQSVSDKRNSDEWMLDYALQKVVSELAPTQKRKVSLLVKAFETVAPAQDDSNESKSNSNDEIKEVREPKSDAEKEKHIKMWHMIYQHVVTDIATRIGSDLLLDGEESTNSEEKNLQEVEDQTEKNYRLQFTKSDAVKLVRESVDEILLPDTPDSSSQSTASPTASDTASEQEPPEKNDNGNAPVTKLQTQRSKNWAKLKKLIMLKRSIKALEGFRKPKPQIPQQQETMKTDTEEQRIKLKRQMMNEKKKAEQWMLDYAVQHIVTKLTPARKKRVSMLVEAFEAVVPFPET